MRKKTTKSKNLDQTDIERDSAGVSNMGIGDLENEEPCLDNEDLLYQNGTEFKNMINRREIACSISIIKIFCHCYKNT